MNNSPQHWPESHAEANKEDRHEKPRVSKSSIKRDAEAVKQLGVALIKLGKNASGRIPLDDDLRSAIELAQKLKKEGYRRQVQLIGKMLRARDITPIQAALDALNNHHNHQTLLLKKLEQLRDRLMTESDAAISDVLALYPDADRQQLRTLIRQAQKERLTDAPPAAFRQLLRYLRTLSENSQ